MEVSVDFRTNVLIFNLFSLHQHLIERSWFAVLDTFILLAAFHQDMSPLFVAKVTLLFVMKSFHWLTSDRVDHVSHLLLSVFFCSSIVCLHYAISRQF